MSPEEVDFQGGQTAATSPETPLHDRLPKAATGLRLAAAVDALGSCHSWRLGLTGPRGLMDTIVNRRPNSP
jgi:hypothetical protein